MSRNYYLASVLATALVAIVIVAAYSHLPDYVATHWNLQNQPNGYSPKWFLFVLGPGFMVGLMLLMKALPWLSPKNFEVDAFRPTFLQIMVIIVCLMGYLALVVVWVGLGHGMNVGRAISGGLCLLFALLGNLMGKVRRNFYVGIRTPWAIANERVWNATHRFAAKLFVAAGVAGLILTWFGLDGWPVFTLLMAAAFVPVVYSLVFYKGLEGRGEL
ncbi:MAG TPA: SdpI family protein [Verrucomicrobiae bacterium]|nr:SdpI family protein [Verrucomicrobiae bacterium]